MNFKLVICLILSTVSQVICEKLIRKNRNVALIPDLIKQTPDFIEKYHYPTESHSVTTEDGFILIIHRIPGKNFTSTASRPVVFIQHGVMASSDQWVFRGQRDLAFMLADDGYDVWLGNTRGSFYSRHPQYSIDDPKFWDYSIHELACYDLAAMVDYVLNTTKQEKLSYIGHSRGGTMAIVLAASRPEYNRKLNVIIGLGPVVYTRHSKSPFFSIIGKKRLIDSKSFEQLSSSAHIHAFGYTTRQSRKLLYSLCNSRSFLQQACIGSMFFISGKDFKMFDRDLVPIIISHFTMGVGMKEAIHFVQIADSDKFRQYDYGSKRNLQVYGTREPPLYNISQITVPIDIYYGANDYFCSEKDMNRLARELKNLYGIHRIDYDKWNHIDYMWAKDADKILYRNVIDTVNRVQEEQ